MLRFRKPNSTDTENSAEHAKLMPIKMKKNILFAFNFINKSERHYFP